MGLAPSVQLSLKQQQSLVMTPQLQQAIKMLQLGRAELASLVEEALASNPLLERAEPGSEASSDSALVGQDGHMTRLSQSQNQSQGQAGEPGAEQGSMAQTNQKDRAERSQEALQGSADDAPVYPLDWREEQRLEDGLPTRALADPEQTSMQAFEISGAASFEGNGPPLDFAEPRASLQAHVSKSLPLMFDDPHERKIAEHLCLYLSPAGYLEIDTEAMAEQLGIDPDLLERIVVTLQDMEPAGLFARSLSECLRLQLQDRGLMTPLLGRLLLQLKPLMAMTPEKAAQTLDCEPEAFKAALASLRRLDPKPGASFEVGDDGLLEADIFLRPAPGGEWLIELNTTNLPRLLINHRFVQRQRRQPNVHADATTPASKTPSANAKSAAEQAYIREQWQSANWLVSALEQRATTLLRVAAALVDQQAAFFEKGLYALRPFSQRLLAERLDLHESTISRVCANKYISTPRGTFELKFFFSSGVGGDGDQDDGQSAKAVQAHIKQIIDQEDRSKPLSDDKIVQILKAQKIGLARRTVTKYREALGFASSVQRKRQYAAQT